MKIFVSISVGPIILDDAGEELYQCLCQSYLEGGTTNEWGVTMFECLLPEGDPRVAAILTCLEERGFRPSEQVPKPEKSHAFLLGFQRNYETEDLEQAQYLSFQPEAFLRSATVQWEGGIHQLKTDKVTSDMDIASVGHWRVISDRVRHLLEAAQFQHVVIRPVEFVGPGKKRWQGKFWELTSDLILPPASAASFLIYRLGGQPFDGDYSKAVTPSSGYTFPEKSYFPPEGHYTASSLKAVEPFDLGLSFERADNWGGEAAYRWMVVSQRFYQFCVTNGLKCSWGPVRVDED